MMSSTLHHPLRHHSSPFTNAPSLMTSLFTHAPFQNFPEKNTLDQNLKHQNQIMYNIVIQNLHLTIQILSTVIEDVNYC